MNNLMYLFKRFYYLLLGKSEAVLNKLESPEDDLRMFVDDLNSEIKKMNQAVTLALADEKKMKHRIKTLLEQSLDWQKKAVLALNAGDESLAKEALVKKEECESQALALKVDWENQKSTVEQLKKRLQASTERVEKAKRDYTVLVARYRTAKTNQDLGRKLNPASQDSPLVMIESLNDKILKIEAETEAETELLGTDRTEELDMRFKALEKAQRGEEALAQLKASIGTRLLSQGTSNNDDVQELKKKLRSNG